MRPNPFNCWVLTLFFGLLVSLASSFVWAESNTIPKKTVSIGIVDNFELRFLTSTVSPTLSYLRSHLKNYDFEVVQISPVDTHSELEQKRPDFFIAPSNFYIDVSEKIGLHHIATRKTVHAENPSRSVGSTFIVSALRHDLKTVADLKGKKAIASLPNSLDGWLAAMGEIEKRGWRHDRFFKQVDFVHFQVPDVISAVLSGASDVGVLSACVLEASENEGIVLPQTLKVIEPVNNEKPGNRLACAHSSTDLYPDLMVASLEETSESIVRDVTVALLSMPITEQYQWSVASDFLSVKQLLRTLEIGPYAYLKDNSLSGLLLRYQKEIGMAALIFLLIVANEIRVHWLVRHRTRELSLALQQRDLIEAQAKEGRRRLSLLERNGVISQMSSLIAHELKQPIGSIINLATVLKLRLNTLLAQDPITAKVINSIDSESHRIAAIVDSVRAYAKKKRSPMLRCDFQSIVQNAIHTFVRNEQKSPIVIQFKPTPTKIWINADPLSLELLVLNLLRNAVAAASASMMQKPKVGITLTESSEGKYQLSVWNTGEKLTQEQLSRLTELGESIKPEGLGLGLAIVREICDEHGARLRFEKRKGGGVVALLTIDSYGELPRDISHD